MSFVSSLKLHNFRCYRQAGLDGLESSLIVLHGPNGAGKTNILEALSLLSPGRGLRGAKALEIQCRTDGKAWAVSAEVRDHYGAVRLGTGIDPQTEKRSVRINGEAAKAQSVLAEYVACVWLTPQMDRLFLDASRERRRFLDRLVFAFDPGHSGRVSRYENALAQRSRLLKDRNGDPSWLSGLEAQMAETGIAIAAARLDFAQRLQAACRAARNDYFPLADIRVAGTIEELLQGTSALETEKMFAWQLAESRGVDMLTGGAATGPHKSDLAVRFAAKDMPAAQCSTGEQKALLIGIVLAHARLIHAERGAAPVLLLDEVAAHLDESRRCALYELLLELGGQAWMTGTDQSLFEPVHGDAQFFYVQNAQIMPQTRRSLSRTPTAA